ncbi:MAG: hypothetical protein HXY25_07195 [Alphaproteobacteria bacterium]|nr:hypothetical protein [Alphaproteobacteria bacterium]
MWQGLLKSFASFVGTTPLLTAPGIIGWQALQWLQTARWPRLNLAFALEQIGLEKPFTPFLGLNVIADWMPLSLAAFIVTILWAIPFIEYSYSDPD